MEKMTVTMKDIAREPGLSVVTVFKVIRNHSALTIASTQWTVESFRRIEEHKVPYVLIDRAFPGMPANFVGVDDIAVGRLATEHLISAGCRRIAHIRGAATSTAVGRLKGYYQALARNDLSHSRATFWRDARLTWIAGLAATKRCRSCWLWLHGPMACFVITTRSQSE
jgi:DNA-binding LacI/PurR family transcriptional regulator